MSYVIKRGKKVLLTDIGYIMPAFMDIRTVRPSMIRQFDSRKDAEKEKRKHPRSSVELFDPPEYIL